MQYPFKERNQIQSLPFCDSIPPTTQLALATQSSESVMQITRVNFQTHLCKMQTTESADAGTTNNAGRSQQRLVASVEANVTFWGQEPLSGQGRRKWVMS